MTTRAVVLVSRRVAGVPPVSSVSGWDGRSMSRPSFSGMCFFSGVLTRRAQASRVAATAVPAAAITAA